MYARLDLADAWAIASHELLDEFLVQNIQQVGEWMHPAHGRV